MAEAVSEINAGHVTFGDLFSAAKFNVDQASAADYNNGEPDYRRVQVGGLPYNGNLDEVLFIPPTASYIAITVDGQEAYRFDLALDDYWQEQRDETIAVTGVEPADPEQALTSGGAPAPEESDSDK